MARVGYKDMRGYLDILEKAGLLKYVKTEVDLKHEIGAISCMSLDDRGPGIMFENIKGHPGGKLAVNIMSTTEQMALAFNTGTTTSRSSTRSTRARPARSPPKWSIQPPARK
ncbi:MAG TPA: hypothetical protein VGK54_09300 [Chloroflexota bacterium]